MITAWEYTPYPLVPSLPQDHPIPLGSLPNYIYYTKGQGIRIGIWLLAELVIHYYTHVLHPYYPYYTLVILP